MHDSTEAEKILSELRSENERLQFELKSWKEITGPLIDYMHGEGSKKYSLYPGERIVDTIIRILRNHDSHGVTHDPIDTQSSDNMINENLSYMNQQKEAKREIEPLMSAQGHQAQESPEVARLTKEVERLAIMYNAAESERVAASRLIDEIESLIVDDNNNSMEFRQQLSEMIKGQHGK